MSWKNRYPFLHELFRASDTGHPDNYFGRMDAPQSDMAIQAYSKWEERFARLDEESRRSIIARAAPLVTRRAKENGRHWESLFETLNEIKGYNHLLDLGYTRVRFLPTNHERNPDIHGSASFGDAFLEVKTVNASDMNLGTYGVLQKASLGLPEGLKRKLESDYASACEQLRSKTTSNPVRYICAFYITIDRQVAFNRDNFQLLIEFLATIETDCEIFHHSEYW